MSLSHAYIYIGGFREDKVSAALSFAESICPGNPFDIIYVSNEYYDVKTSSEKLSVDAVRAMIRDAYLKPGGDHKVFIIDKADDLNQSCQNALLKIIEEPPSYCVFIFIAENVLSLLETVVSRCRVKTFNCASAEEIFEQLSREHGTVRFEELRTASRMCKGSLSRAEQLINSDFYSFYKETEKIFEGLFKPDSACLYGAVDFFLANKEKASLVFDVFTHLLSEKIRSSRFRSAGLQEKRAIMKFMFDIQFCRCNIEKNANFNISIVNMLQNNWGGIRRANSSC